MVDSIVVCLRLLFNILDQLCAYMSVLASLVSATPKAMDIWLNIDLTAAFDDLFAFNSEYAVLPVENTSNGPVKETAGILKSASDRLLKEAEVLCKIQHSVWRCRSATGPVYCVASHEQVSP